MIAGARQGWPSGLRRLVAAAMARDLRTLVVPGPEVAWMWGLDLLAAGLRLTATPRDADVLLLIGPLPPSLCRATAVIYAQMVRPRAILALGTDEIRPLPPADVSAELSRGGLREGVARLRTVLAQGAFSPEVTDFDAAVLHGETEYVCPMHPEVVQNEPGSCPKCGMKLVVRDKHGEGQGHTEHAQAGQGPHADHAAGGHGPNDGSGGEHKHKHSGHGKLTHAQRNDHDQLGHAEYVYSPQGLAPHKDHSTDGHGAHDDPDGEDKHQHGSHGEQAHTEHGGHGHAGHKAHGDSGHHHDSMGFMSMVEVTKDLPRSRDGLAMDWLEVPFGPFFPGLPGGLQMKLTLDGDGVARGKTACLADRALPQAESRPLAEQFIAQLTAATRLAPVAFGLLACRAVEAAAGHEPDNATARARLGGLERERVASHLGWLALSGRQIGLDWLTRYASRLQRKVLEADVAQLAALRPAAVAMCQWLARTPLLKARLAGIGRTIGEATSRGPVARAAGRREDARLNEEGYRERAFDPVLEYDGDALARWRVRLGEIEQSLELIVKLGAIALPVLPDGLDDLSGSGRAELETPRGRAGLDLTLERGRVTSAELDPPCRRHYALIPGLVEQQELGDALVAVGSLDLSPWEVLA